MDVEQVRVVAAFFFLTTAILMTRTILLGRAERNRRIRRIYMWFFALILNAVYGSWTNFNLHVQVTLPTIIACIVAVGLTLAMAWNPEGDDKLPPDDGALGSWFLNWLDGLVRKHKYGGTVKMFADEDTPFDEDKLEEPTSFSPEPKGTTNDSGVDKDDDFGEEDDDDTD